MLVGSFNPTIFQPAWFGAEKLIQREEAERAEIQVIASEAVVFSVGWLGLEVTHDRMAVHTSQSQYSDPLRDLVLGTFRLLRHTPIKQMGINRLAHFRSANDEDWHNFGHLLAPKEPWTGVLEHPGMRRLSMLGERSDGYSGRILVTIEPSVKVKPGIYFEVNDNYLNDATGAGREADRMMEILDSVWQTSIDRSYGMMTKLLMHK